MAQPALVEDPNDPGTYLIQNFTTYPNGGGSGSSSGQPQGLDQTTIKWDASGKKYFELGIDRGVLYVDGINPVPWNGLVSLSENPSGGDPTPYYIDGIKYLNRSAPEEFNATLEAYTYPDEFGFCDGTASMAAGLFITQQKRNSFGLVYRTKIGNDVDGQDHGYKIHIVYNALAIPAKRTYSTIGDTAETKTFSWDISTRPVKFYDDAFGTKYGSHLVIDSRTTYPWAMLALEKVLFGDETTTPKLPNPQELLALFVDNSLLKITDNGDGTWTADGPESIINMVTPTEFEISWPSAVPIDETSYNISSL